MLLMLRTLVVLATLTVAGQAQAYGLFTCVDAAGREVCVLDTGPAANIIPSQLCNAHCPACAGQCNAAKHYETQSGHWQQSWQGTPGITGNNILVPGASPQGDAQTILREGLVAPQTPPTVPPAALPSQTIPEPAYGYQVYPAPTYPAPVYPAPVYPAPGYAVPVYPAPAAPGQAAPESGSAGS